MADTFIHGIETIAHQIRDEIARGPLRPDDDASRERLVNVLEQVLAAELACAARYAHEHRLATAVHGAEAARPFADLAQEEHDHARLVADRLRVLGRMASAEPSEPVKNGHGHAIEDLVRSDIVAERMIVHAYGRVADWVADTDAVTAEIMRDLIESEELHSAMR